MKKITDKRLTAAEKKRSLASRKLRAHEAGCETCRTPYRRVGASSTVTRCSTGELLVNELFQRYGAEKEARLAYEVRRLAEKMRAARG